MLALGQAVDLIDAHCDGFHLDVMDGLCVPDLLFGPVFVEALRRRTDKVIDVHLMLTGSDAWIDKIADAGADVITVHRQFCKDLPATLAHIRARGLQAGLAVELLSGLSVEEVPVSSLDRALDGD